MEGLLNSKCVLVKIVQFPQVIESDGHCTWRKEEKRKGTKLYRAMHVSESASRG
jgi:hypothetical protein